MLGRVRRAHGRFSAHAVPLTLATARLVWMQPPPALAKFEILGENVGAGFVSTDYRVAAQSGALSDSDAPLQRRLSGDDHGEIHGPGEMAPGQMVWMVEVGLPVGLVRSMPGASFKVKSSVDY